MSSAEDFQMILDFAEGTLDQSKEDLLFLRLSSDEELRQEFKSHMAVRNAIRVGAASVVLPAASKAAVFSSLGLQLGGASGFSVFVHHLFSRRNIAAAGILLFLSVMSYLFINNSFDGKKLSINQNYAWVSNLFSPDANLANITTKNTSVPNISSVEPELIHNNRISGPVPESEFRQNISHHDDIALNEKFIDKAAYTLGTTMLAKSLIQPYEGTLVNRGNIGGQINKNDFLSTSMLSGDDDYGFSFMFGTNSYYNIDKPTISPSRYSDFNNLSLTLIYKLSSNFSVGANVRQETFFLRYKGIENNQDYIYEQQPNFTTFSAIAKYKLDPWNGFSPYAQLNAGINSVGFAGRGSLGIEYSFNRSLSILVGFEYSSLLYTHQNNYFNSSKFGLNYGLSYSF